MTMKLDPVIQVAVAKTLGSVVLYVGAIAALMYPVLDAAGYLA